jgi:hypothetical protein
MSSRRADTTSPGGRMMGARWLAIWCYGLKIERIWGHFGLLVSSPNKARSQIVLLVPFFGTNPSSALLLQHSNKRVESIYLRRDLLAPLASHLWPKPLPVPHPQTSVKLI